MTTIPRAGSAFLLAQLGAHAAARFGERIAELDLTPPQAGLLRAVATEPGRSQQALSGHLGMPASRLVSLVDGLADRGLLERRRNPDDRRLHALHLTAAGEEMLGRVAAAGRAHEDELLAALDGAERDTLHALLTRIAERQGLTPGVHPGYKRV
ncbi:winged helix-turn-helix transcriptional regulator [Pseudonocardia sp. C8]|uniref:MarR family winged helix-turn-helix transcriptional regulator n=1 Tax=Pseudonocardia sp. C8 TaxID=2762759 RepID=UPI0016423D67|nr:MarR family winged helix-turn-helix transcriptional regulator [Pseudonocardia sp. C8]MBC3192096.1 winged helix-turn-helix transcriptional regulator [Pseudonocardia sp. C8]